MNILWESSQGFKQKMTPDKFMCAINFCCGFHLYSIESTLKFEISLVYRRTNFTMAAAATTVQIVRSKFDCSMTRKKQLQQVQIVGEVESFTSSFLFMFLKWKNYK